MELRSRSDCEERKEKFFVCARVFVCVFQLTGRDMVRLLCSSTAPASLRVRSKAENMPSRYVSESVPPSAAVFWSFCQTDSAPKNLFQYDTGENIVLK